MPGARIVWMVMMKFSPVKIELKPVMKMPVTVETTFALEKIELKRRVKRPARIDAAQHDGRKARTARPA